MDVKSSAVLGVSLIVSSLILVSGRGVETPRYQLAAGPGRGYVLDTRTGEVWEKFAPENSFESDGKKPLDFLKPKLVSAK